VTPHPTAAWIAQQSGKHFRAIKRRAIIHESGSCLSSRDGDGQGHGHQGGRGAHRAALAAAEHLRDCHVGSCGDGGHALKQADGAVRRDTNTTPSDLTGTDPQAEFLLSCVGRLRWIQYLISSSFSRERGLEFRIRSGRSRIAQTSRLVAVRGVACRELGCRSHARGPLDGARAAGSIDGKFDSNTADVFVDGTALVRQGAGYDYNRTGEQGRTNVRWIESGNCPEATQRDPNDHPDCRHTRFLLSDLVLAPAPRLEFLELATKACEMAVRIVYYIFRDSIQCRAYHRVRTT